MRIIVFIAAMMHLIWGLALFAPSNHLLPTTAMHSVLLLGRGFGIVLYLLAGFTALGTFCHPFLPKIDRWLLVPQQGLLLLSGYDAMRCIVTGKFADGASYPVEFILRDQAIYILLACIHLAYMFGWDVTATLTSSYQRIKLLCLR